MSNSKINVQKLGNQVRVWCGATLLYCVEQTCLEFTNKVNFKIMNEKFNYQIVFKLKNDNRVIFAGVTTCTVIDILDNCIKSNNSLDVTNIESVVYQPLKNENYETKKN